MRTRRPFGVRAGIAWDRVDLGTRPDAEVARELGVVTSAVGQARRARGIPACPRGRVERLGAQAAVTIGYLPDRDAAVLLGVEEHHVRDARRRAGLSRAEHSAARASVDWARIGPRLGSAPDAELARREGISVAVVHQERVRRGIPRYRPPKACPCGARFEASFRSQRWCSDACAWAARSARRWRRYGGSAEVEELAVAITALRREIRRRM